nr:lipopolysaccharide assembly protein LapA domain-containing protein [Metabacillus mangrovi]
MNVEPVEVNYLFGEAQWPLILIVLASVLIGALMVGFTGMNRTRSLKKENKTLRKQLEERPVKHEEPLAKSGQPEKAVPHTDEPDHTLPSRTERKQRKD